MTIYTKPRAELFAQNAPPSEIKPFAAWLRGLGIAFDETNGYPELESFNGLLQALNSYIKYLEQNGFAEWSSTLEYPIGAGVRVGAVWYRAKVQNTNKPPATSQNEWTVFLNANDLSVSDPLVLLNNRISVKDATTTQKGVVRMATSTEVANRSNVSAFVKPSDIPVASTTAQGIARFATASEVTNKTNVTAAVTPSNAATIAQSTDLGIGQSWQNVTSSRSVGVTYTNNTGKPIQVMINHNFGQYGSITLGGVELPMADGDTYSFFNFVVPNGSTYRINSGSTVVWAELR
jgi:hypothetical protein